MTPLRPPSPKILIASHDEIDAFARTLRRGAERTFVAVVRGKKMTTFDALYDEFEAALQFPSYFGRNWNALRDSIADLTWLEVDHAHILVTDAWAVLADEASDSNLEVLVTAWRDAAFDARNRRDPLPALSIKLVIHAEPDDAYRLST